ncbi:MAG: MFS transporter [Gaiellaceae bacterium]
MPPDAKQPASPPSSTPAAAGGTKAGRRGSPIVSGTPRRNPTLAGFLALGLFWGAWAAVLPSVQQATHASKGALGFAMLFVSVGSIPSMFLLAAPAVRRFGARAVAIGCGVFAIGTTLPGLATSLPVLIVTLTIAGIGSGLVDVGINANVGRIETETGGRLMPLAHGIYSVGILVGAVGAGLARSAGLGREPILVAVAVLIALTGLAVVTDDARVPAEPSAGIRIARGLILIGFVGAAAFVVEGGMESWSALFLERQLHAQPAVSGLGPGIFGASMALGRFFGQAAVRFSDRALLGVGALLGALGCALAAAAPNAPIGLLGFAIGGAGVSLNAPIVFGLAARRPDAGTAVATVTTIGYLGLLVGPPLVGGVAQVTNLRVSFVVLALVAAAVAVAATRLRLSDPEGVADTAS